MSKLIFTNGCFDVIHRGHIEILKYCKSLGGKVVVGLNSDGSVKALKGANRPINNQKDRKEILEAIRYVDEVLIFEEDNPYNLIKKIQPDIIVKGDDYTIENVVGNDISEVRIFKRIAGYSTTNAIQSIISR